MEAIIHRLRQFSSHPYARWIAIFVASNALIHPEGGTNQDSRFAAMCAMVEDRSFQIDHYKSLTIDWARTPDGHYYSNKAPGPMLLAYPVFWLIDKCWTAGEPDRATRDRIRISHRKLSMTLLSLLFQALPFAALATVALSWLEACGVSTTALHVSCVAILFGNTASLFMNTYFGHGMAATCMLGLCLCVIKRWYVWGGLTYGLALLADYGSALLLPGFLVAALLHVPRFPRVVALGKIALGGLLPGILWVVYHISCFGGVLTLPSKYQNPLFVDTTRNSILGLFTLAPHLSAFAELLFGFQRGILWSQPWLLILLAPCIACRGLIPRVLDRTRGSALRMLILLLPGFFLLLWMNASFGEWQGGSTPGPRYMCSVFPSFGLLSGLLYDDLPLGFRRLLVGGVAFSVAFWILAFSTQILVPAGQTMWGFMFWTLGGEWPATVRLAVLSLIFEWQGYRLFFTEHGRVALPGDNEKQPVSKSP